mgnify:CR=1 FL=1
MRIIHKKTTQNILDNTKTVMDITDKILLPSEHNLQGWFDALSVEYKSILSVRFFIKEIFTLYNANKHDPEHDIELGFVLKDAESYFYEEKYDENELWWNAENFQKAIIRLGRYIDDNTTYLSEYISPSREMLYEISHQTKINASYIPLPNLHPLKQLLLVEDLSLQECELDSLEDIEHLSYLKVLDIQNNNITSLKPLSFMRQLQWLGASKNNIYDISPLSHLLFLEQIDLRWNHIKSIEPLRELRAVKILYCGVNEIENIDAIANMSELLVAGFSKNKISSLEPLAGVKNILKILVANNRLTDIGCLREHKKLTSVDFRNNQVSDLRPIFECEEIRNIGFDGNPIEQEGIQEFIAHYPSCFIHTNDN